jgi:hypothetical protein
MPVSLTCTKCKVTLKVRDELAGKKVKCPRCSTALVVPKADEDDFVSVEVVKEERIRDKPPKKTSPRRDEDEDDRTEHLDDRPSKKTRRREDEDDEDDRADTIREGRGRGKDRDRERIRADRPRGKHRDDDDDEEDDRDHGKKGKGKKWKPCPRCGAEGAKRVLWTAWGSFYGPAMFSHVRCPDCGYCYNGKSGGSNIIPAIIFVAVPLIGILGIIGGIIYMLIQKNYIKF